MGDENVYVYEYGEAYDDLRAAFYIDERDYADPELAQSVVEAADAAMTRAGVIYEVEVTSGVHARTPVGVPTWEEFKQRHFVEGTPLPVRPRPVDRSTPPSWAAMIAAVEEAHEKLRAELLDILTTGFPGNQVRVVSDPGPLRRSPGSIDWSEERYGFEITVSVELGDISPAAALDTIGDLLGQRGWQLSDRTTDSASSAFGAEQFPFSLWADARPLKATLLGQSALYRSPPEPGSAFVVEAR